jgi:enoyl-[acyl-carrier protein] reductase I
MAIMKNKKGLIMGVANERSIAWGIARKLSEEGAQLAFSYHFIKQVLEDWAEIDFIVHALAYSDKEELKGKYVDCSRENFLNSLDISAFSFTRIAKSAFPLMNSKGGSLLTLSYLGAERTTPNYNVMGVAKSALEASIKYLAMDLGKSNIRVNGLSAGPVKTLAGAAISGARHVYRYSESVAPLKFNPELSEISNSALYLLSDLSSGVTGNIHHVDGGLHSVAVPRSDEL